MKPGAYAVIFLLFLSAGAALYTVQLRLDASRGERKTAEEFMYLPGAQYLKVASLGYEQVLADLLWLQTIQHLGERNISGAGYDWIYKALDTVTTLDPKFLMPYAAGSLSLTIEAGKVDLSIKLLKKGVENIPDNWQLPFYLGFNYFFYSKDYKSAAKYIEMAASKPGSPPYLPALASRLYVEAEDPAYALQFLLRMYENTKDEKMRESLLTRINLLKAAVDVKVLQETVDLYIKKTGRKPSGLDELVSAGFLKGIPEEPNGGYYYIGDDGKVHSSKLNVELGIYTRGGR